MRAGVMVHVDPSILTVQSWVHDNPDLARKLLEEISADSYTPEQLASSGISVRTLVGHQPISEQVPAGAVLIILQDDGTIIFVFNPPTPGQTSGVVRVTVLSRDIPGGAGDVYITVGPMPPGTPPGTGAYTYGTHGIQVSDSFDRLEPWLLVHEITHVKQAYTTGFMDNFNSAYLSSYVFDNWTPFKNSFWRDMEAEANKTDRQRYDSIRKLSTASPTSYKRAP